MGTHDPAVHERQIRKSHVADARNRLQLGPKIPLEMGDFRIAVPSLPRVDLEEEQVLALETQSDGVEIHERLCD